MRITHMYAGDDGESHFEDLEIPLERQMIGPRPRKEPEPVIFFRASPPGLFYDYHAAPGRYCMIPLSGVVEVEVGEGSIRRFGPGDVLFASDTTGRGHMSRTIEGLGEKIFVPIPDEFDVSSWRSL